MKKSDVQSAGNVVDVLEALMRADYVRGATPGEVRADLNAGRATGDQVTASAMTRYLSTLVRRGAVETLGAGRDTRYRPSVRWGRYAAGILRAINDSQRRLGELEQRIQTPID